MKKIIERCIEFYNTFISVTEAYFLPSNKASNIIKLKAKVFSLNSWYTRIPSLWSWKLFTNQKQVICFVIRKESILNPLEDLLTLNICIQSFSVSEIINGRFQDWAKQNNVRSLKALSYNRQSTEQLVISCSTGYQKTVKLLSSF